MKIPTACYRLQFRNGMDFYRGAALAPYLAGLGISHLYASPIFTARKNSTHGYDVTDPSAIDPSLGGMEGLRHLSRALAAEGLGLVLDMVPNHMAFSVETPWLRDVLRHGDNSRYAGHFALDLEDERIRLPWLPSPFEDVLARGDFAVEDDAEGPVLVSGGLRVPLRSGPDLAAARKGDPAALRALHAAQPWGLVYWRTESDAITHRRFFNITGLIGIRVEDAPVFDDVHRLLLELVAEGVVDGIRIDHVDGLADPAAYLERLRAMAGPQVPIWVEKILTGSETLPSEWPVEGTTGYVAARTFSRLLTDNEGLEQIDAQYRAATGREEPVEVLNWQARRQIMTNDLAAELWILHRQFAQIAAADPVGCEFGPETLREAILAFIAMFPRYRTYMTASGSTGSDAALVRHTAELAAARLTSPGAVPFLAEVLTGAGAGTARFRLRMQQVTGAAVAKSQEDTAFYRAVRLLSANEVGSEAEGDAIGVDGFHRAMVRRAARMPHGLTLTSSHDTKRSEDARMRIAAISLAPEAFQAWFRICHGFAPERLNPNLVWYVAQTFMALDQTDGDLADRLAEHVVKALREAKTETFWTAPDLELEQSAQTYVRRLAQHFPRHAPEVAPILAAADRLSQIQTALKLTVPGIPDIYQGCEFACYSLTDPDNRRAVDFAAREAALNAPDSPSRPLDRAKFALTRTLLTLRKTWPKLFADGSYHPLDAPAGICAFARRDGDVSLNVALSIGPETVALKETLPTGDVIWPRMGSDTAPVRVTLMVGS